MWIPLVILGININIILSQMDKLINAGYKTQTIKLEEGVSDYVNFYLKTQIINYENKRNNS